MLYSTLVGNLLVAVAGRPDFRDRSPAADKGPLVDRLYTLMSGLLSPATRHLMGEPVGSAWWRDRAVPSSTGCRRLPGDRHVQVEYPLCVRQYGGGEKLFEALTVIGPVGAGFQPSGQPPPVFPYGGQAVAAQHGKEPSFETLDLDIAEWLNIRSNGHPLLVAVVRTSRHRVGIVEPEEPLGPVQKIGGPCPRHQLVPGLDLGLWPESQRGRHSHRFEFDVAYLLFRHGGFLLVPASLAPYTRLSLSCLFDMFDLCGHDGARRNSPEL